jgi:hypothetical protein
MNLERRKAGRAKAKADRVAGHFGVRREAERHAALVSTLHEGKFPDSDLLNEITGPGSVFHRTLEL